MKLTTWALLAMFATCSSAKAADLFFVVGQADSRWHAQGAQAATPADVKLLNWTVGSKFKSVVSPACKERCRDVSPVDGVVPAFANTWTSLSKTSAHFIMYLKPDAALTRSGSDDKRYWTDYEARAGIYQDALQKYRQAQQGGAFTAPKGFNRRYLIWVQNETDARAGVSADDYRAKLIELFDQFNKDLGTDGQPFDAMFIVSSGLVRKPAGSVSGQNGSKSESAYLDNLNAIVTAQDRAAAEGKIVMVSRSMRRSLSGCAGNLGSPGCATKGLLSYHTWLYETLGTEMARNAFTYHSKGIKPLLPANCKHEPSTCAGTVEVYRWVAKEGAASNPVYGTDPREFDEGAYRVGRLRLTLFVDSAPGRIPLYRNTESGGPGLSITPGSGAAKVLGYCYAAPTGNANARLMAMHQDGMMIGLARQSVEASQINALNPEGDKTLCYVN